VFERDIAFYDAFLACRQAELLVYFLCVIFLEILFICCVFLIGMHAVYILDVPDSYPTTVQNTPST
jgi:hypothetical protein